MIMPWFVCAMLGCQVAPSSEVGATRTGNAALDYYKAVLSLRFQQEEVSSAADAYASSGWDLATLNARVAERYAVQRPFAAASRLLACAASRPHCDFERTPETGENDWEFGGMMDLRNAAVIDAALCRVAGKHLEAATILEDTTLLGIRFSQDAVMIQALVGAAISMQGIQELQRICCDGTVAARERLAILAQLRKQFAKRRHLKLSFQSALERERAWQQGHLQALVAAWPDLTVDERGQRLESTFLFWLADDHPMRQVLLATDARFLERLAEWSADAKAQAPWPSAIDRSDFASAFPLLRDYDQRLAALSKDVEDGRRMNPCLLSGPFSGYSNFAQTLTARQARIDAFALACAALELAASGIDPASSAELARLFPDGVPLDPHTGEAFELAIVDGRPVVRTKWRPPLEDGEDVAALDHDAILVDLRPIFVLGSDYSGVILASEAVAALGISNVRAFQPTPVHVAALEAALRPVSERAASAEFLGDQSAYRRQYVAYEENGALKVVGNFIHVDSLECSEYHEQLQLTRSGAQRVLVTYDVTNAVILRCETSGAPDAPIDGEDP
ncbi:MAG: hypothetical protein ACKVX7_07765 [Planctomycetota bacterium]